MWVALLVELSAERRQLLAGLRLDRVEAAGKMTDVAGRGEREGALRGGLLEFGQLGDVDVAAFDFNDQQPGAHRMPPGNVLTGRQQQPAGRLYGPQFAVGAHAATGAQVSLRTG